MYTDTNFPSLTEKKDRLWHVNKVYWLCNSPERDACRQIEFVPQRTEMMRQDNVLLSHIIYTHVCILSTFSPSHEPNTRSHNHKPT